MGFTKSTDRGPGFPEEISPEELHQLMDSGEPLTLVDCRRPDEHAFCRIGNDILIPLNTLPQSAGQLKGAGRLVVYCHHGVRSLRAVHWLRQNGYPQAQSMTGGIDAWSQEIDGSVPRY